MIRTIAKYRTIFVLGLVERMTYRTDFFLGTLMRFLPVVTTIFLWSAIYEGSRDQHIGGLTSNEMISYYLLVMVSRAFSSMPGLASGIAFDIREGHIKKYLIQPVNMVGYLLTMRVAHKIVYYAVALAPYGIVFYLCRSYLPSWPEPELLIAFIVSLVLAFLIGFLFETLVGLFAFWVLEISSFNFIIITLTYILSGHMFPLDLLPEPLETIVKWLPFQYFAYFPVKLYLHGDQWSNWELVVELGKQLGHTLLLFGMVLLAYRRGLKRYSAYGG